MAYYRLYSLDLRSRHITDVSYFEAECDVTAIAKVKPDRLGISRELWNLGRKVQDFAPRARRTPRIGLEKLIGLAPSWRWNPLEGNCQLVGDPRRGFPGPPRDATFLATDGTPRAGDEIRLPIKDIGELPCS